MVAAMRVMLCPIVKAVIFDKDGTLIDIHHYWVSIIKIRASLIANKWFKKNFIF